MTIQAEMFLKALEILERETRVLADALLQVGEDGDPEVLLASFNEALEIAIPARDTFARRKRPAPTKRKGFTDAP